MLRELPYQPFRHAAGRGDRDGLALEIGDSLDRTVLGDDQRHHQRRSRHRGDTELRRALGDKAQRRARTQTDIDRFRGKRLLQLGGAAEIEALHLDAVLGENAFLDADIERHEGEHFALRLADTQRIGLRNRAEQTERQSHARGQSQPASETRLHRDPLAKLSRGRMAYCPAIAKVPASASRSSGNFGGLSSVRSTFAGMSCSPPLMRRPQPVSRMTGVLIDMLLIARATSWPSI